MKAKVVSLYRAPGFVDSVVGVKVRRNYVIQHLDKRYSNLKIGDTVEVHRQVNNPYLVRN